MGISAKMLIDYKLMNFLCYQLASHTARGRSRTIRFVSITNGFSPLISLTKISILRCCRGPKSAYIFCFGIHTHTSTHTHIIYYIYITLYILYIYYIIYIYIYITLYIYIYIYIYRCIYVYVYILYIYTYILYSLRS